MYSLLNYIAATSKDLAGSSTSSHILNPSLQALQESNAHSAEVGLSTLTEDEKRLVGISTISVVTRLALEFDIEEVRLSAILSDAVLNDGTGHSPDHIYVAATHSLRGTYS